MKKIEFIYNQVKSLKFEINSRINIDCFEEISKYVLYNLNEKNDLFIIKLNGLFQVETKSKISLRNDSDDLISDIKNGESKGFIFNKINYEKKITLRYLQVHRIKVKKVMGSQTLVQYLIKETMEMEIIIQVQVIIKW